MQGRVLAISGALVCFAIAGLGAPPTARAEDKPKAAVAVPDLSGSWAFNKDLSDDAHEKVRDQLERRGGGSRGPGMGGPGMGMGGPGSGGGGRMSPPPGMDGSDDPGDAMKLIFNPAEELTIYQGQPDLVIDEKFSRRRTLHADGRKYKADNGSSEVKTEWREGRLVIETRGFRGQKTTETWEPSTTGKRLTSLTKIESGYGGSVTIKRVYDKLAAPSAGGEPADKPAPPPPQD
jgi:hypothetical protein